MLRQFDRIRRSSPPVKPDPEPQEETPDENAAQKQKRPWYIRIPLKFAINIVRLIIAMAMLSFLLSFIGKG